MAITFANLCKSGLRSASSLSLLGEPFTLRGREMIGVIDSQPETEMFMAGGSVPKSPVSITILPQTFTPALNLGERVTVEGVNYTVRSIDADVCSITLICERTDNR